MVQNYYIYLLLRHILILLKQYGHGLSKNGEMNYVKCKDNNQINNI